MTADNPTNADLLKEIRAIRGEQNKMRSDLDVVIEWKRGLEIGKAAVDEYKRQQSDEQRQKLESRAARSKTEVLKQLGYILALGGAILYAFAASRGII